MHYQQLRSVLSKPTICENLKRQATPFEQVLLTKDDFMKHKLSMIYDTLLNSMPASLESHRKKWERDCEASFDIHHWTAIYQKTVLSTKVSTLRLQAIKLLNHRYITPSWLYKTRQSPSSECWKGCSTQADTIHCWWQSPLPTDPSVLEGNCTGGSTDDGVHY